MQVNAIDIQCYSVGEHNNVSDKVCARIAIGWKAKLGSVTDLGISLCCRQWPCNNEMAHA